MDILKSMITHRKARYETPIYRGIIAELYHAQVSVDSVIRALVNC